MQLVRKITIRISLANLNFKLKICLNLLEMHREKSKSRLANLQYKKKDMKELFFKTKN
jgi:hypothetical protein